MLDLNDVRNFVIVARKGTFRAAAQEMCVPTSTIARSITRLEKHLNISLVKRSVRGVFLTDAGTEFLESSKQALRTIKAGSERLQERRFNPSGLIRVMSPMVIANTVLLPILPEFLRRYPELRVELDTYTSNFEQEPGDDIDVFFKIVPPKESSRRMRKFPTTARGLFASTHYVQRAGVPQSPEDLLTHCCIGAEIWKLQNDRDVKQIAPQFRVTTTDPFVMRQMVLEGIGIAVLPLYMAMQPDIRLAVVPLLPSWVPAPAIHSALYFGTAMPAPKLKLFLDFVAEFFGTERDPRVGRAPFLGLFGPAES